jgi:hypothetical protein
LSKPNVSHSSEYSSIAPHIAIRFRWVSLQLNTIFRCRSITTVKEALSSLPPTLYETYARILQQIADEKSHVRHILSIICVAVRPIHLAEVAEVYQIGDDIQPPFMGDSVLFHPEDIIDISQGLLSLMVMRGNEFSHRMKKEPNVIIQLAHFSVK